MVLLKPSVGLFEAEATIDNPYIVVSDDRAECLNAG